MTNFERMRAAVLNTVFALDEEELRELVDDTDMDEAVKDAVFSCGVCEKAYGRCDTVYNGTGCMERYHDWCGKEYEPEPGWEDKAKIVRRLTELLKVTRMGSDIDDLVLSGDRKMVSIRLKDGTGRCVNIEGDSGYAIIKDVLAAL